MTPTLLPVRPGLHSTDVGLLGVCHCHCHCHQLRIQYLTGCLEGETRQVRETGTSRNGDFVSLFDVFVFDML